MSMVPEYGQLALIISLFVAGLQFIVPAVGLRLKSEWIMAYARPLAIAQATFLIISLIILGYGFVHDDFSISYIANNSNTQLPYFFKISAIWGAHEGSLLLWIAMLGAWGMAVAMFSRSLPLEMMARVLSVLALVSVGFILFIVETSNPFARSLPNIPLEGEDLNPLLQDFGLIVHPPMLYMGYVGLSVAFAFAMAALIEGRLDAAWARWTRPWTTAAWVFLTLGIALGSWWAYYELGWGGWWFWDPVENASLLPWLAGTALMHSLAVTEKRGVFKSWTVLLAIFAFSLSLLGAFLVRSGVLTSVHAFAADPDRGMFILIMLVVVIGGSLLLYALRAGQMKSESSFSLLSRESMLLVNNVILVVACAMVLLGTIYPLIVDALGLGKLSVGPPYFNALFNPMAILLMLALGIGSVTRWRQTELKHLLQQLWLPALLSLPLGFGAAWLYSGEFEAWVVLSLCLSWWVVLTGVREMYNRVRHRSEKLRGLLGQSRSYYGMQLAHLGVVVAVVGVALVSYYTEHRDLRMQPGDTLTFRDYTFVFEGSRHVEGPNFTADQGQIQVLYKGKPYAQMHPQKRLYTARGMVMTEAAINPGFTRDLYVALGEPLANGAWAVRMQYKPYVRWIWLGGLLMTAGGLLAASDPRYRKRRRTETAAA